MTPAPVGLRCPDHSGKPQGIQKVTRAASATIDRRRLAPHERGHDGADRDQRRASIVAELAPAARSTAPATGSSSTARCSRTASTYTFGPAAAPLGRRARRVVAARHVGVPALRAVHLALNMYSLYFAGSILEQVIGRWRFLLLYLGSGHRGLGGRARAEPARRRPSARRARSSASSARSSSSSAAASIATGRPDRGPDRAEPRLHALVPRHLRRRHVGGPDRRRRADVALLQFASRSGSACS